MNEYERAIVNLFDLQWVKGKTYRNRLDVYVIMDVDTYIFRLPQGEMRVTARKPEVLFGCLAAFEKPTPNFIELYGYRYNETEKLMELLRHVKDNTPDTVPTVKPYLKGI